MNRTPMSWAVQHCYPPYRSACALYASWRVRWEGTLQKGRWAPILPDVWGRFA